MIPESFSEYFTNLDESERHTVIEELLSILSQSASDVDHAQSEVYQTNSISCPSCQSNDVRANGKYKDVQRYHCKCCNKYFRDTPGKIVFGLKKGNLLKAYLYHMLMGYSIKKCAEQTGICIQTSFDWRHKILSAFKQAVPEGFQGITESDDIFFLESGKGSRELPRKSRKRDSKATKRGISDEQIAVVTCDRSQNKELKVATKGRISKKDLDRVFEGKMDNVETLYTDTHRSYTSFAKDKELEHQKNRGGYHIDFSDDGRSIKDIENAKTHAGIWSECTISYIINEVFPNNHLELKYEEANWDSCSGFIPKGVFNAYIIDIYGCRNGRDSFEFGFYWTGNYYEIDILEMPSYGSVSTDLHDTHRLPSNRGGYRICFGKPRIINSMSAAKKWAGAWSELTIMYIREGIPFPNS